MFGGLNWIDGVIVVLLIAATWGSFRVGFLTQVFVIGGFFGTLFLGGWLFPHLLSIDDRTVRTIINANLVILSATFVALKGYEFGRRFHWSIAKGKFRRIESGLGVVPGIAAALIITWLLTAMVGRLPFAGFSNSASDALIVQALDQRLPSIPAVFAVFNHQVDPSSPPKLFVEQLKPQPSFAFSPAAVESAETKAAASVVRLTGFGCGGVGGGTGFVITKDLAATNAHVITGVKRPIVKYDGHSYEAVPVVFNASLDFAVLRVLTPIHDFKAPPLQLAKNTLADDTTVAVLGYPGGNYTVTPGIIRNNLAVRGRNIYDHGVVTRHIYEIQTNVDYGSSGAPVVLADGKVAGIVFAKYSTTSNKYAFALTSHFLADEIQRAKELHRRVSTGVCLAE